MSRILLLGHKGMLGTMVHKIFPDAIVDEKLDARIATPKDIEKHKADWIINCIGIIKPYIETNAEDAIKVNSLFPYTLAKLDSKIIQIATDCVFSGSTGYYRESFPHDALDIYGKTKSLGEVDRHSFYNIRCSIIGPQAKNPSLLQWFLDLPQGSEVKGFTTHKWNGITTEAFAKVCEGIMKHQPEQRSFHLIPRDYVNKYDLLRLFAEVFNRPDITITPDSPAICDRRLGTNFEVNNKQVWQEAGYEGVPTIKQLLNDLKKYL